MINYRNIITLFMIIGMIVAGSSAHNLYTNSSSASTTIPCEPTNNTFINGEKLVYKVYYNWGWLWIGAGELTLHVRETDEKYVITARGNTYSSYEWMFRVNDFYETHIDKSTMRPIFSKKLLEEGGYRLYEELTFDWDAGKVYGRRGKDARNITEFTENLENCSWDLVSMMYALRTVDYNQMSTGEKTALKVYLDKKTYNVDFVYEKSKDLSISKLGDYNVKQFYAMMEASNTFGDGAKLEVFVTDDKNNLPLMLTSDLAIGSAKIILSDWENLKYPISSKIK